MTSPHEPHDKMDPTLMLQQFNNPNKMASPIVKLFLVAGNDIKKWNDLTQQCIRFYHEFLQIHRNAPMEIWYINADDLREFSNYFLEKDQHFERVFDEMGLPFGVERFSHQSYCEAFLSHISFPFPQYIIPDMRPSFLSCKRYFKMVLLSATFKHPLSLFVINKEMKNLLREWMDPFFNPKTDAMKQIQNYLLKQANDVCTPLDKKLEQYILQENQKYKEYQMAQKFPLDFPFYSMGVILNKGKEYWKLSQIPWVQIQYSDLIRNREEFKTDTDLNCVICESYASRSKFLKNSKSRPPDNSPPSVFYAAAMLMQFKSYKDDYLKRSSAMGYLPAMFALVSNYSHFNDQTANQYADQMMIHGDFRGKALLFLNRFKMMSKDERMKEIKEMKEMKELESANYKVIWHVLRSLQDYCDIEKCKLLLYQVIDEYFQDCNLLNSIKINS